MTLLLYFLLLIVFHEHCSIALPSITSESKAKSYIFMTRNDNSVCKISLLEATDCEEVVGKLPQCFDQITSLARSDLNSKLYFVANETNRDSSTVFASFRNKHWCLYHGHGLKQLAYDWSTDNLFIAANGLGIGVCTSRADLHKKCSHIIAAHKRQLPRGYGSLLAYPQRGVIYWLDYNSDHPNGVVMKAGMNGKNITSLTDQTDREILEIALDDLNDNLFVAYTNKLVKISLSDYKHGVTNMKVNSSLPSASMVSVNGSVYSMSRANKTLFKLTGPGKNISMPAVGGQCVRLAYSAGFQDARYQEVLDPCLSANCSHNCVLNELFFVGSKPSSTCLSRDDDLIRNAMKPKKESLKIAWIQIGCLMPTVIVVYIISFFLIYEIVSSYQDYLSIVDQQ